jgi:amidase
LVQSRKSSLIFQPAAACGVYSFKPTAGRLPTKGLVLELLPSGFYGEGWPRSLELPKALEPVLIHVAGVDGSKGPFGRCVEDLELWMKVVIDSKPWLKDPR